MTVFFLDNKLAVVHMRAESFATDVPEQQMAVTTDGSVWTREVGGWRDPPPPDLGPSEGWIVKEKIPKSQIADWLAARLAEGWLRIGD